MYISVFWWQQCYLNRPLSSPLNVLICTKTSLFTRFNDCTFIWRATGSSLLKRLVWSTLRFSLQLSYRLKQTLYLLGRWARVDIAWTKHLVRKNPQELDPVGRIFLKRMRANCWCWWIFNFWHPAGFSPWLAAFQQACFAVQPEFLLNKHPKTGVCAVHGCTFWSLYITSAKRAPCFFNAVCICGLNQQIVCLLVRFEGLLVIATVYNLTDEKHSANIMTVSTHKRAAFRLSRLLTGQSGQTKGF